MAKKKATRKKASAKTEPPKDRGKNEKWHDHRNRFREGNPGRPKGSLSLIGILKQELAQNGEQRAREVVQAMIDKAAQGDTNAARLVLEHIEGRPLQRIAADITQHEPTIVVRKEKSE